MSILKNIVNRGLRDVLNPKRWGMFFRSQKVQLNKKKIGELRALLDEYSEIFNDNNLLEQVTVRMSSPGCRSCIKEGECIHCGCKSPDLFFEKDMECSGMNWFPMIPSNMWEDYRDQSSIIVDQDYLEQIKKHGKIINFKDINSK